MKQTRVIMAALIIGSAGLAGCANTGGDRVLGGAALGAGTGALIGGVATGRAGGALAGAAIGAASGAILGAATDPGYAPPPRPRCARIVYDYDGNPVCQRYYRPASY